MLEKELRSRSGSLLNILKPIFASWLFQAHKIPQRIPVNAMLPALHQHVKGCHITTVEIFD